MIKKRLNCRKMVVNILKLYHITLSSLFPNVCRFTPTCSVYMASAIEQKGILKGSWLGIKRLAKCHPFHQGGYDPLPH
jgi:uncharacterized protein